MGTIKATNIEPIADNGTVTLGSSGDTFSLGSGVKQSNLNNPSFYAYKSSGQTISTNTNTKVTFETELFDSDNAFADSRFTPGVAGKYLITAVLSITNHQSGSYVQIRPYKNGSEIFNELNVNQGSGDSDTRVTSTFMVEFDADDYLEIYLRHNGGSTEDTRSGHEVRFMAQRIGT